LQPDDDVHCAVSPHTLTTTCRDRSAAAGVAVAAAAARSTGTPEPAIKRELSSSATQQGEQQQQQQSQEQQSGSHQDGEEEAEKRRVMLIFSDAACMPDRQTIFRLARRYCKDVGFWAPTESTKNGRGYWVVTYPTVAAAQAAEAGLAAEGHRQLQLPARVELRVHRVSATDSRDGKQQRARKEHT